MKTKKAKTYDVYDQGRDKYIANGLTKAEAKAMVLDHIRRMIKDWGKENAEKLLSNFEKNGFSPFTHVYFESGSRNVWELELTDTFGGEANYSWVRRERITAKTMLGAVQKFAKESGLNFRKNDGDNESATYYTKSKNCVLFVNFVGVSD